MNKHLFVTGIGTGVGKTLISAILCEALGASYWKPIQAGFEDGTDAGRVESLLTETHNRICPSVYRLEMPASPHIAARKEGLCISLEKLSDAWNQIRLEHDRVIVEGAGGIEVPLNDKEFVTDLVIRLKLPLVLVSRNYLGSINHSLLTAHWVKSNGIPVLGWIFNDQYLDYAAEIVTWSGFPMIGQVPFTESADRRFVQWQAELLRPRLLEVMKC